MPPQVVTGAGFHQIGQPGDPRQRLLDPFETADRRPELLAHRGIGAGTRATSFAPPTDLRRQRDRPAGRSASISIFQPLPRRRGRRGRGPSARPRPVPAVGPLGTGMPIGSWRRRSARPADRSARGRTVIPRSSPSQQILRIAQPEGQAKERRDRRQRDVALVPGEAEQSFAVTVPEQHAFERIEPASSPPRSPSARSTGSPRRGPGAAGTSPSARPSHIRAAARPGRPNWG